MNSNHLKFVIALKNIIYLSQIGLSLILPIVGSIILAVFIKNYFNLSYIVVFIGIILGLGISASNMIFFIKRILKEAKKSENKYKRI